MCQNDNVGVQETRRDHEDRRVTRRMQVTLHERGRVGRCGGVLVVFGGNRRESAVSPRRERAAYAAPKFAFPPGLGSPLAQFT